VKRALYISQSYEKLLRVGKPVNTVKKKKKYEYLQTPLTQSPILRIGPHPRARRKLVQSATSNKRESVATDGSLTNHQKFMLRT